MSGPSSDLAFRRSRDRLSLGGLLPSRARLRFAGCGHCGSSRWRDQGWFSHDARGCFLRVEPRFPALMRLLKFAFALVEDRLGAALEFVDRRDVSDRAVETFVVVMIDV